MELCGLSRCDVEAAPIDHRAVAGLLDGEHIACTADVRLPGAHRSAGRVGISGHRRRTQKRCRETGGGEQTALYYTHASKAFHSLNNALTI